MAIRVRHKKQYDSAREIFYHYIKRAEVNPVDNGLGLNVEVRKLWPEKPIRDKSIKTFLTQGSVGKKVIDKHQKLLNAYTASKGTATS